MAIAAYLVQTNTQDLIVEFLKVEKLGERSINFLLFDPIDLGVNDPVSFRVSYGGKQTTIYELVAGYFSNISCLKAY